MKRERHDEREDDVFYDHKYELYFNDNSLVLMSVWPLSFWDYTLRSPLSTYLLKSLNLKSQYSFLILFLISDLSYIIYHFLNFLHLLFLYLLFFRYFSVRFIWDKDLDEENSQVSEEKREMSFLSFF